jgi:Transcription initiation factor TFIID, subunit TAF1
VPLWWYLPAIGVAVLLGAEVHMGYPGVRSWIGYAVTVPLFIAALFWLGRTRVRMEGGELHVGDASLPVRHVGRVEIVPKADKQVALGPDLDPSAFLLHRGWVGPVVRVEVTDPEDPTPYWIFSVRDPGRLVTALGR